MAVVEKKFLVSTVNIFMPCLYCMSIDRSNRAIFTQFSRNLCFSLEQHVNTRTGQEQSHCPTGTRHFVHLASFVRHPFRINLSRRYFAPKCFPHKGHNLSPLGSVRFYVRGGGRYFEKWRRQRTHFAYWNRLRGHPNITYWNDDTMEFSFRSHKPGKKRCDEGWTWNGERKKSRVQKSIKKNANGTPWR